MSVQFNDTSTYKGLVQLYEKEIGATRGFISGNTDRLKEFTADCNLALDDFTSLAINSSGIWQWDDSNQTDYPIITANLVASQRDYSFTTDGSGNYILDVYKVLAKDSSGTFHELQPVDVNQPYKANDDTSTFTSGANTTGTPTRYDKLANGLFLDPIPSYNSTGGLKMYVNREASYFTSSDTTKKAGIPGIYHKYLYLVPALDYARRHSLAGHDRILQQILLVKEDLKLNLALRDKSVKKRLSIVQESNR